MLADPRRPRVKITVDWAGFSIEFEQEGGPLADPLAVYDMATAGVRDGLVAAVALDDGEVATDGR